MLVYLDVAHLAWLQRADALERESFFSDWSSAGAELVVSFHHLQEIGQLSTAAEIDRRFDVLTRFRPVRGGLVTSAMVLKLEIQSQLEARVRGTTFSLDDFRQVLFPPANLRDLHQDTVAMAPLFRRMREGHELGAEAERLSQKARATGSPKMRSHIDPDAAAATFANVLDEHFKPESSQRAVAEAMHTQLIEALRQRGTLRGALENIFGLREMEVIGSVPHDDLAMMSVFRNQARQLGPVLSNDVGIGQDVVDAAVEALNPYRCPGFALKLAAQRARRQHPKHPVAGDQLDDEHVTFAPYTDLHFVDKRTLDFVQRELRRREDLVPLAAASSLRRARNLADIATQIRSAE